MPDAPVVIAGQVSVTQVRLIWKLYTKGQGESSWSFIMPAAAGDVRDIVRDKFNLYLLDKFRAARPGGWHIVQQRVEDRYPGVHAPIVDDVVLGAVDESDGIAMPPQVTPVISWRTGIPGRSFRGRTYMGPYGSESLGPDNEINDPANSAVFDFAETMMGQFTGPPSLTGPTFAIVSRTHNGVTGAILYYTLPITYFFLTKWGTMRRRNQFEWRT